MVKNTDGFSAGTARGKGCNMKHTMQLKNHSGSKFAAALIEADAPPRNDLAMLARYVVGVIAQNDRQQAERKARRCGLINFRVQEYASRVFAARLNAETRKQNKPCLK